MAIALEQVSFEYVPGRPVLRGVTLAPTPGKVTALIGPNGAGKSTLLRIMLGVLEPTRGRVLLEGRPLSSVARARRSRLIAYIPQRTSPAHGFTVLECVGMGSLSQAAGDDAGAMSALERVGLASQAGEVFDSLSAGQQQRAVLARALLQLGSEGAVLLADEPVSAMDPRQSLMSMSLLRERAAAGAAVVAAIHDFALAEAYCDEAAVLGPEGGIVAHGPVGESLSPEVLGRVFGVPFRRADRVLTPTLPGSSDHTRIGGT